MKMLSERDRFCRPQYLDKLVQCWNCKKDAMRNIVEWISHDPNKLYKGNYQVISKKPVIDYKTGKKYWRYKLWDYKFKMNFGFFCTANCAMIYGNKAVLKHLQTRNSFSDTVNNLDEAKTQLAEKWNTKH